MSDGQNKNSILKGKKMRIKEIKKGLCEHLRFQLLGTYVPVKKLPNGRYPDFTVSKRISYLGPPDPEWVGEWAAEYFLSLGMGVIGNPKACCFQVKRKNGSNLRVTIWYLRNATNSHLEVSGVIK